MFDFITINWDNLNSPQEIASLVVIVVAIGIAVYYLLNKRIGKDSLSNYKEAVDSYKAQQDAMRMDLDEAKKETESCNVQHQDTLKQVQHLQGQIDVLKDVPLNAIHKRLDSIDDALKGLGNRRGTSQ